jgi:hypothetical protein
MSLLRRHSAAIILAFVMAAATSIPPFFIAYQMGDAYQGIFPISSDDDRYYEARSQEVRDGFPHLGNPYIYELRDTSPVSFWLPDAVLSYTGKLFGLDVQHTFAFFDVVLCVILFLITYATLIVATRSIMIALLGSSLFHIGLFLDAFTQSPSPQFNFIFVELAVLAGLAVVQKIRFAPYALTGVLGALFYVYPYYWTFIFAAIGMFFLATLIKRDLRVFSVSFFGALIGGLLLGAPVLIQMFLMGNSLAYQETIVRLGMIYSRTPAGLASLLLSGGTMFVYAIALRYVPSLRLDSKAWFFVSVVFGGLIASNHHMVTGQNLEFSSHYFLPVAYVVVIAVTYLFSFMAEEFRAISIARHIRACSIVLVALFTLVGGSQSVIARITLSPEHIAEQRYAPVLRWLNQNTSPESVVFAAEDTSYLIAAYTRDRIFYSRNANLHVMTDEEVWTRFVLLYYDEPLTDEFFQNHVGQIWGAHYFDEYGHEMQLNKVRKLLGLPQVSIEVIPQKAKDDFRAFVAELRQFSPNEVLVDRRIDYAISELGFRLPVWMQEVYPDMRIVQRLGEFTIYELGARPAA